VTLQAIRSVFEGAVITGANAVAPVLPVYVDNQSYTDNDAAKEFVLVRVNFGEITEPTFCENVEHLRGSLVVEVFTAKGKGPGRGQTVATEIARQLNKLRYQEEQPHVYPLTGTMYPLPHTGGFYPRAPGVKARMLGLSGPSFTPLDGRPHFMTRLSGPLVASYT
jgi:hypothetical protein